MITFSFKSTGFFVLVVLAVCESGSLFLLKRPAFFSVFDSTGLLLCSMVALVGTIDFLDEADGREEKRLPSAMTLFALPLVAAACVLACSTISAADLLRSIADD